MITIADNLSNGFFPKKKKNTNENQFQLSNFHRKTEDRSLRTIVHLRETPVVIMTE